MLAAKEWNNTDPKDAKSISLPTRLSTLDLKKAYSFATVK